MLGAWNPLLRLCCDVHSRSCEKQQQNWEKAGYFNLILKQKVYFRLRIPEGINVENKSALSEEDKQIFFKNFMIYLSSDAKSWAPYTDIKAVKKVFGIQGGSVSFGMGITKQDGLSIYLNVKTTKM